MQNFRVRSGWQRIRYCGRHLIFYTSSEAEGGRQPLEIKSIADIYRAAELQVIFYSDKTNPRGNQAVGQGKARSFFAIRDLKNTDCMVRDMARSMVGFRKS